MSRNWRKFDQNFNWSPCSDLGSRKNWSQPASPALSPHNVFWNIHIFFALALAVIFGWPKSEKDWRASDRPTTDSCCDYVNSGAPIHSPSTPDSWLRIPVSDSRPRGRPALASAGNWIASGYKLRNNQTFQGAATKFMALGLIEECEKLLILQNESSAESSWPWLEE